jgi:PAS domain S-box-containing protein
MTFANPSTTADELLTLFEMTPDLVCLAGKDGYFIDINPAVPATLGYSREELFARPIFDFLHPDDLETTSSLRSKMLEGEALVNFQNRYITRSGKVVWLEWTSVYIPGKDLVFAIAKNITARKKIEHEVEEKYRQFRKLASEYKTSFEQDRKHVAAELHDEVAQLASAVRLEVDWISTNVPQLTDAIKSRIHHSLILADLLVDTIRRLSFSISPSMLDDLGLNAALEWYCKEFSLITGIACSFEDCYDESTLSKEMRLDFFRICQEVLANIKDHAQASWVRVSIKDSGEKICICVCDDGIAFDAEKKAKARGVLTMRERVALMNGKCTVYRVPKNYRRILVEVCKQMLQSLSR